MLHCQRKKRAFPHPGIKSLDALWKGLSSFSRMRGRFAPDARWGELGRDRGDGKLSTETQSQEKALSEHCWLGMAPKLKQNRDGLTQIWASQERC